jgi:hypothetical protein
VNVKIFVEGGGNNNEDTITRCRQGFGAYCAKVAEGKSRPKIVPCGGRDQAFKRFREEIKNGKSEERYALLVDSEGPAGSKSPVDYLSARDHWVFPPLNNHQVFLMVQAMEAWFLADRATLAEFYGDGFLAKSLPGSPTNVEAVIKDDLELHLRHASKPTLKGEYHKTKHGFALLERIDSAKVEMASAHAKQLHDFLRGSALIE